MLVYRNTRKQGLILGLRLYAVDFAADSASSGNDSIFVSISDDDIVSDMRQLSRAADPGWPWWPF